MQMTYREALREGIRMALESNPRVFLVGEDIGAYGGTYAVTKDFLQNYGPQRIMDAPLSENGFTGIGVGAAMGGMRPIVEIMTINFSLLAFDQIINSAAIYRHMSGGQISVPLIIRTSTGGGRQLGAQHSNSLEGWMAHIPGIKILTPATVEDARCCLHFALKESDPVIVFEYPSLMNSTQEVNQSVVLESPFTAKIQKSGKKLTIITWGAMLHRCLEASLGLEEVEVIDLRCLRPLDDQTIFNSIKKTHRALIVEDGWRTLGLASEICTRIMESCFYELDFPVQRLTRKDLPMPYSKHLEDAVVVQVEDIQKKIREMLS
jgi:pyruvate dehydrogenase E1 component beta subunit